MSKREHPTWSTPAGCGMVTLTCDGCGMPRTVPAVEVAIEPPDTLEFVCPLCGPVDRAVTRDTMAWLAQFDDIAVIGGRCPDTLEGWAR